MSELKLAEVLLAEYARQYGNPNPAPKNLDEVITLLHKKPRAALCISGGGIRSASFALGVIQGLAKLGKNAADSVLNKIDYLSTVSGGGYIGSWLSGWAQRKKSIEVVIDELRKKPADKFDPEPDPVQHLREYSNYLTPKLGFLSADTWAFFGAYFRNLLLMWLVLVTFFVGLLSLPRIFVSVAVNHLGLPGRWFEYTAIVLFYFALAFVGFTRPTKTPVDRTKKRYSNGAFQLFATLPLILFAVTLVVGHAWFSLGQYGVGKMMVLAVIGTVLSSVIYTVRKFSDKNETGPLLKKQAIELAVSLASGVLLGGLIYLFLGAFESPLRLMQQTDVQAWVNGRVPLLGSSEAAAYIVFGVPLVILALLLQATVFVGGTGRFNDDFDREWWGRAAAWVIIAGIGWIVVTGVVIYGPIGIYYAPRTIAALGGVTGLLAVGAGRSSKTGANDREKEKAGTPGLVSNLIAGLATPIFALVLLAALSLGTTVALRAFLEKRDLIDPRPAQSAAEVDFLKRTSWTYEQKVGTPQVVPQGVAKLGPGEQTLKTIEHPAMETDKLAGLDHLYLVEQTPLPVALLLCLAAIAFAVFASWLIGVNRFSMHALYRDRIIRAYLGASNDERNSNPFTGFDPDDNIPMKDLLIRPMHVVNMCLNLASGDNLAWQERKAESFTATPLHCGNYQLGYRPSAEYGGPRGMTLGTAVGISGAAASPNMGYHSSPALALILTFFNVRLGWWLGNPGEKGESSYMLANPRSSLRPLLSEAFGMSNNTQPYVYLSDGGHFENLGFYEMVMRRCRNIIISDGGSDADFVFEDLGNAIRKIYIDFGIRVVVEKMELFPRSTADEHQETRKYCATGRIFYADVDSNVDGKPAPEGRFVYIKPVFYKQDLSPDIYNYGMMNDTFPHQSTGDQFFSESQLESYRALGEHSVNQICKVNNIDEEKARKRRDEIHTVEEFIDEVGKYTNPPAS